MSRDNLPALALRRAPAFARAPGVLVRLLEAIFRFGKVNEILHRPYGTAEVFARDASKETAQYERPPAPEHLKAQKSIFVSNHPLGGADSLAAVALMEELGRPYVILSNNTMQLQRQQACGKSLSPLVWRATCAQI